MSDTGTFGIHGIPPPEGLESKSKRIPYVPGMPLRHEISEVADPKTQEGKDQWTLFVLALERFKNLPVDDKLSYFQVAGIHDYPRVSWDQGKPEPRTKGYCTHNTLIFSTWHRVYMMLYEQLIWKNMNEIIDAWELSETEIARWKKAADGWRLPYWDWARKQKYTQNFALPQVLTLETVEIFPPQDLKVPIKNPETYPNPLFGFENPEKKADGTPLPLGQMPGNKSLWNIKDNDEHNKGNSPANPDVLPWSLTTGTGRWGIKIDGEDYTGLSGVNNFTAANEFIANMEKPDHWYKYNPGNLSDSVNRLFCKDYNSTWGTFASTKWPADAKKAKNSPAWLSLEYIHNNVHNITGGFDFDQSKGVGHMSDVPVAAFDPIFWLHHCQIDRLLAIWQALYWDLWWDSEEPENPDPNPEEPYEPDATPNDLLEPFHTKSNGSQTDVWTSNDVRNWTKLGYQYDDLDPKPSALNDDGTLNEEQYKIELDSYIHKTYPGSAQVVGTIRTMRGIRIPKGLSEEEGDAFKDYIINIQYDRYALRGTSYSIKFYLGGQNNVPETNYVNENYIGEVFTFTAPYDESDSGEGGCANCKAQAEAGVLSQGQIPLTIPVLNHIYDHEEDHPIREYKEVAEYLELHLNWKFVQHGGLERDPKDFPNTKVTVLEGIAQPRYTDPELSSAAEVKSVAGLAVNRYALKATNELEPISAENVPEGAIALTPAFKGYHPIYKATAGKEYGLEPFDD
ncbi:hypothetical protein FGRMN_8410 [Fusarium graminum]|nr:hypothetical protein FGRMN_8410 [Fusarium graminum]